MVGYLKTNREPIFHWFHFNILIDFIISYIWVGWALSPEVGFRRGPQYVFLIATNRYVWSNITWQQRRNKQTKAKSLNFISNLGMRGLLFSSLWAFIEQAIYQGTFLVCFNEIGIKKREIITDLRKASNCSRLHSDQRYEPVPPIRLEDMMLVPPEQPVSVSWSIPTLQKTKNENGWIFT